MENVSEIMGQIMNEYQNWKQINLFAITALSSLRFQFVRIDDFNNVLTLIRVDVRMGAPKVQRHLTKLLI